MTQKFSAFDFLLKIRHSYKNFKYLTRKGVGSSFDPGVNYQNRVASQESRPVYSESRESKGEAGLRA